MPKRRSQTYRAVRLPADSPDRATEDELRELALYPRPVTRRDCEAGERPCPFVACKHHLFLDVNETGSIRMTFPGHDLADLEETCSLDVAREDGATLLRVGDLINLTRERIRQIEVRGLALLRTKVDELDPPDILPDPSWNC